MQCFMKCYLETVGVLSSDNEITMKQATSHFSTSEDIISNCVKEQSDIGMKENNMKVDLAAAMYN